MVDEERMRPDYCLGRCFSVLTQMVGWQEEYPCHQVHETLFWNMWRNGPKEEPADTDSLGKWLLNENGSRNTCGSSVVEVIQLSDDNKHQNIELPKNCTTSLGHAGDKHLVRYEQ